MKDQFENCGRCDSKLCYTSTVNKDVTTYLCLSCGFTTSSVMTKDSKTVKNFLSTAPELYKDLSHIDDNGYYWVPSTITVPDKGMVFLDGTTKQDWKWVAVKPRPLTELERKNNPVFQEKEFTMDMKNKKEFGQLDFSGALIEIGVM